MKQLLIIISSLFMFSTAFGQQDSSLLWQQAIYDTNANFYDILKTQESYFSRYPDLSDEGGSQSEFLRWKYFWYNRVDNSDGKIGNIQNAMKKYNQAYIDIDNYFPKTSITGSDWSFLGPKNLDIQHYGIISSIAIDRNDISNKTIYVGTGASGLWKTIDGGTTWKNLTNKYLPSGIGIIDIALVIGNPQVIYIATGTAGMGRDYSYGIGILKSTNGGQSWTTTSMSFEPKECKSIRQILINESKPSQMIAFCDRDIYRTFDGWTSKELLQLDPDYIHNCVTWVKKAAIEAKFSANSNFSTVYVCVDGYLYGDEANPFKCLPEFWKITNVFSPTFSVTDDWTRLDDLSIFNENNYAQRYSIDETILDPDNIYLGGNFTDASGLRYKLYAFDKITNQATEIFSHPSGNGYGSDFGGVDRNRNELIMSDSDNPDHTGDFFVGGFFMTKGNYLSNAAELYEGQYAPWPTYHVDTRDIDYILNQDKTELLFIGNDGGVTRGSRKNTNQSPTFTNINGNGLFITQFYGIGLSEDHPASYAGGSQDNGFFYYYPTQGSTWQNKTSGVGDAYDVCIHKTNKDVAYFTQGPGIAAGGVMKTINGFQYVDPALNSGFPGYGESALNNKPLVFNPVNYNEVYVGYHNIYKANVDVTQNPPQAQNFDNQPFFIGSDHGVYISESINSIAISPSNENIIYIAYAGVFPWDDLGWHYTPKLLKTIDKGANWSDMTANLDIEGLGITSGSDFVSNKCGITSVSIAPDDPNRIWITFGNFPFRPPNNEHKYRVLYSSDGGTTFIDRSDGLPELPVNSSKVIGSNDNYTVFVGTDAGVFKYNNTSQKWEPFNNHLPPSIVTDFEYVESPNLDNLPESIRISTFGYGLWETQFDCNTSNENEIISVPTTWNTDMRKNHNVYLAPGASLTITSKISFTEGTGIFVRPRSQLYVHEGVLTSACGSLWNGVSVLGDPNQSQTNLNYQGYAEFINATIENALAGVRTLGPVPRNIPGGIFPIEPIPEPAGGIIKATSTTFRNNYISVLINPCSKSKIDQFKECIFEVTSELLSPGFNAGPLVKLNDVNKTYFQGCTFRTDTNFSPNNAIGIGILSNNSTFYVDALCTQSNQNGCTQWKYSEFSNLDYGVKALAFTPTRNFKVDKATLIGNNTGIYASGVSLAQITRNNFQVDKIDTLSRDHFGGVYLDFCNGYKVEDNIFNGPGGGDNAWAIGVIVNNSNYGSYINADNEIYNNNFNTLNIGILAQNKNRSNDQGTNGLTIKCNDFYRCRYDVAVTVYDPNILSLGIMDPQGQPGSDIDYPAGNIFSDFTFPPNGDYNYHNGGGGLTYYHHDIVNAPDPSKVKPSNYSNITPQISEDGNFYNLLTCCLSRLTPGGGGGIGIEDQKDLLGEYESDADSVSNLLTLFVDGGNTQQTKQEVVSSTPPEALEIYNDLLEKSPYLSDTVMVSAVKQETVLDAAMVTDILTENPQAAKSDTVLLELENRVNPLSDDQMANVMQGLYITGAKEALESNLAGYRHDYSRTMNNIIRYYSGDTLNVSPEDSILSYLAGSDYFWARYQQAFILNEKGDTAAALFLLGELSNSFPFSMEMTTEHQNYLDLIHYYNHCRDSSTSIMQPDSMQVSALVAIVQDSSGLTQVYARNLLVATRKIGYFEPYLLPVTGLKDSRVIWAPKKTEERNSLKIYPNPAGTYCIVETSLKDFRLGAVLEIADNQGKKVKSLILTKNHDYLVLALDNLLSGLYICTIISDGKNLTSAKFVVNW